MSNHNLYLPSAFVKAPLKNGIGRFIVQLQRLTLKFCKSNGASRGMREFIECDMVRFAKENPEVVIYLKPRRHRSPVIIAEFLNGYRHYHNCHNNNLEEVRKWIDLFRTQAGCSDVRYRKFWHTDNPSIQGPWNPFINRDPRLNLNQFPVEHLSQPVYMPPSATEKLLAMYKEQQQKKEDMDAFESDRGQQAQ